MAISPSRLEPMLVRSTARPPFGKADWLFEVKQDGIRLMAYLDGEHVRLLTRRGRNVTSQLPELGALRQELGGPSSAILDGELVAYNEHGIPDFGLVLQRIRTESWRRVDALRREIPVAYVAFDLLELGGHDLRAFPLSERKARLRTLIGDDARHVAFSDHWQASDGEALFRAI